MKKLSKIKLQNLSQEELGKREQELLRGGADGEQKCGCICVCMQNVCACLAEGSNVDSVDLFIKNQGGQSDAVAKKIGSIAKIETNGGYGYGYGYAY